MKVPTYSIIRNLSLMDHMNHDPGHARYFIYLKGGEGNKVKERGGEGREKGSHLYYLDSR